MKREIEKTYNPLFLEIINDSDHHKGHKEMEEWRGSPGGEIETHFTIILVSNCFENLSRIQRHRQFYGFLKDLVREVSYSEIHALSLELLSPQEFEKNL